MRNQIEMARRIGEVRKRFPWLVIEHEGAVAGYAYASLWKTRSAYRFAVESTVYLAPEACGRGLGRTLYAALLGVLGLVLIESLALYTFAIIFAKVN